MSMSVSQKHTWLRSPVQVAARHAGVDLPFPGKDQAVSREDCGRRRGFRMKDFDIGHAEAGVATHRAVANDGAPAHDDVAVCCGQLVGHVVDSKQASCEAWEVQPRPSCEACSPKHVPTLASLQHVFGATLETCRVCVGHGGQQLRNWRLIGIFASDGKLHAVCRVPVLLEGRRGHFRQRERRPAKEAADLLGRAMPARPCQRRPNLERSGFALANGGCDCLRCVAPRGSVAEALSSQAQNGKKIRHHPRLRELRQCAPDDVQGVLETFARKAVSVADLLSWRWAR